jgi:hypothetical protein
MYRKTRTLAAAVLSAFSVTAFAAMAVSPIGSAVRQDKSPVMSARPGSALTAAGTAANPPTFSKADANHDGLIEANEANAIGIPFATLDVNNDGMITRSEYNIATAHYYHRSAIELYRNPG